MNPKPSAVVDARAAQPPVINLQSPLLGKPARRRQHRVPLLRSVRLALSILSLMGASLASAEASEPVSLNPSWAHPVSRVRMELTVKGNVHLAPRPDADSSRQQRLPLDGKVTVDFEERILRPAGTRQDSEIIAVERQYHQAEGASTLSKTQQTSGLRPEATHVLARRDQLPETIYSQDTYLTQDELDLLGTPISASSLDRLIPETPLKPGDEMAIESSRLASAFNLSGVADSDVKISLVESDAESAKLLMRGKIDGSVRGVPTVQRILAKLTFDRVQRTVTWAAVAIHETREIGKSEPGFDVQATVRMIRQPLPGPQRLPKVAATVDFAKPVPSSRLLKAVGSDEVRAAALLDRRWHLIQDSPGQAVLKMIDNELTIAQCNLRPLAKLKPGEQITLDAFQRDCVRTLGKQASGLLEAGESLSETGLRVLRVAAAGEVQGVPIHWIMLHFSDDSGRRVLATLTMDADRVEELDGSDVQLVATMTITDGQSAGVIESISSTKTSIESGTNEVESEVQTSDEVISASDLGSKKR
ncbi:MAG: hypothetical protein AAGC97_19465 [Planctomycetota bacterium]